MTNETLVATPRPGQDLEQARIQLRTRALKSLYVWNKAVLGMKDLTPDLHGDLCDFISMPSYRRKQLQAARAHLKTSNATIGKRIWKATRFLCGLDDYNDFEYPAAVVSSTATNAQRMSRETARLWIESPVRQWLFPEVVVGEEWSKPVRTFDCISDGRTIRRAIIEFFGVGARASSRHYRALSLDDMHAVEEGTESPPAVEDVVNWYKHTESLLIEPEKDEIDLIGTPCSLHPADVYLYVQERESEVYATHRRPCYNQDGNPAWPQRFPRHVLENTRRKQGDFLFSLQYLLVYIDPATVEFRSDDLVRYTIAGDSAAPLFILEDRRKYYLPQLSTCMTVDLAGWRGEGDDNAIIAAGRARDEMTLLLETWRKRCPPDEVIAKIIELHKRYAIPVVGVEEVGYQQCLSYYLERAIDRDNLALTVKPLKTSRSLSKDARIRAMQPLAKQRMFAIRDDMVFFLEEWTRFNKGKKHLLDCFAYLPQVWETPFSEDLQDREDEMRNDYLRAIGHRSLGVA